MPLRDRRRLTALAKLGAIVSPSIEEAINASEIIIVNVSDYEATETLVRSDAIGSAVRGKLIVQLTSGTPNGAREAAEWYTKRGVLPALSVSDQHDASALPADGAPRSRQEMAG